MTVVSSDANGPITLLICDDHKILTDALAMVVERDGSLRMIASPVHVPEEAIELCREHQPDGLLGHVDRRDGSLRMIGRASCRERVLYTV